MALTPDDVLNKSFQTAKKFREGYDQDEVDYYLDEVVAELRRLNEENQQLKDEKAELDKELQNARKQIADLEANRSEATGAQVPQPVPAEAAGATQKLVATPDDQEFAEADSATNLLQLARKLHEEHVREGIDRRDELISEGESKAEKLVRDAEAERNETIAKCEQEKSVLEHRIEELRSFERDYRGKLRSYIEGQLSDLNAIENK